MDNQLIKVLEQLEDTHVLFKASRTILPSLHKAKIKLLSENSKITHFEETYSTRLKILQDQHAKFIGLEESLKLVRENADAEYKVFMISSTEFKGYAYLSAKTNELLGLICVYN